MPDREIADFRICPGADAEVFFAFRHSGRQKPVQYDIISFTNKRMEAYFGI